MAAMPVAASAPAPFNLAAKGNTMAPSKTAVKTEAPVVAGDNGTRLDTDNTIPPTTQPGDAPADTKDPTEFASTVTPNPGPEALAAGVVVGAVKIDPPNGGYDPSKSVVPEDGGRVEEYDYLGKRIRHNIDTGKSEVIGDAGTTAAKHEAPAS